LVLATGRYIGEGFDDARRGFPREAKRQLRGFGGEATYQLGHGWGKEIARQIFGPPKGRRGR
jgi:hypothetical protein